MKIYLASSSIIFCMFCGTNTIPCKFKDIESKHYANHTIFSLESSFVALLSIRGQGKPIYKHKKALIILWTYSTFDLVGNRNSPKKSVPSEIFRSEDFTLDIFAWFPQDLSINHDLGPKFLLPDNLGASYHQKTCSAKSHSLFWIESKQWSLYWV